MARTTNCPAEDNGKCAIPDQTVVVRGNQLSIQSRESVEAEFPELDLEAANLRMIELPISLDQLIQTADESGSIPEEEHPQVLNAIRRARSENESSEGAEIVVYCSPCGHTWVWPAR